MMCKARRARLIPPRIPSPEIRGVAMNEREKRQLEKERREKEQQRIFVEGLKKYRERGIPILIDGKECPPEEYDKIFELKEDGSFYMGDYIGADTGRLMEIRFDRVYYK